MVTFSKKKLGFRYESQSNRTWQRVKRYITFPKIETKVLIWPKVP